MKFNNLDALKEQLKKDAEKALLVMRSET
ncbi:MAG: hypothetical protein LBE82_02685 [Chitinophagaceae bacterium]|nr:hypothetical protein [Chitinophagaceae bacterium]